MVWASCVDVCFTLTCCLVVVVLWLVACVTMRVAVVLWSVACVTMRVAVVCVSVTHHSSTNRQPLLTRHSTMLTTLAMVRMRNEEDFLVDCLNLIIYISARLLLCTAYPNNVDFSVISYNTLL